MSRGRMVGQPDREVFLNVEGRLAQFRSFNDLPTFWETRWAKRDLRQQFLKYSKGYLDEYEDIFTRYLPKHQPVLEAGCGTGDFVVALRARGYSIEGIDYATETINRLKAYDPTMPVRVADIFDIDVPDECYGGYISLGILEHDFDGPLRGLKEVKRVLRLNGVALISVPYLNPSRARLLGSAPRSFAPVIASGLKFYQYYFSPEEFSCLARQMGLSVVEMFPYGVYSGLTRDFRVWKWMLSKQFFFYKAHRMVIRLSRCAPQWLRWRYAHMLMFVIKKSVA